MIKLCKLSKVLTKSLQITSIVQTNGIPSARDRVGKMEL